SEKMRHSGSSSTKSQCDLLLGSFQSITASITLASQAPSTILLEQKGVLVPLASAQCGACGRDALPFARGAASRKIDGSGALGSGRRSWRLGLRREQREIQGFEALRAARPGEQPLRAGPRRMS